MSNEYFFSKAFGSQFALEVEQIFNDVVFAYRCLEASDWRERVAALEVLIKGHQLNKTEQLFICKRLSLDNDESVRAMAIAMLARWGTENDASVARRLLEDMFQESFRTQREIRTMRRALAKLGRSRIPTSMQQLIDDTNALLQEWQEFDAE